MIRYTNGWSIENIFGDEIDNVENLSMMIAETHNWI